MKTLTYKLNLFNNLKRGALTIPLGIFILFIDYLLIRAGVQSWQVIFLFICLNFIGIPGLLIHITYMIYDFNKCILHIINTDYIEVKTNRRIDKITKTDIISIDKIIHNSWKIPWSGYELYRIKMKDGRIFSITNLSINFNELYELIKINNRQIKIFNKFRLI